MIFFFFTTDKSSWGIRDFGIVQEDYQEEDLDSWEMIF